MRIPPLLRLEQGRGVVAENKMRPPPPSERGGVVPAVIENQTKAPPLAFGVRGGWWWRSLVLCACSLF